MIIFASSSLLVTIPHPAIAAPANHSSASSINAASPSIVANFTFSPANPTVDVPVSFDASSSYAPTSYISSYEWSWGDGSFPSAPIPGSYYRTTSHTFQLNGTFTVTLTVTDGNGNTATTSRDITISMTSQNTPPAALFSYTPTRPLANQTVTFDATAARDPDGDPVTSYHWSVGACCTPSGPIPGTLFNASGRIFTHVFSATGGFFAFLNVTDDHNLSANQFTIFAVTRIPYVPGVNTGDHGLYYLSTNQTGGFSQALGLSVNVTSVSGTEVRFTLSFLLPNGTIIPLSRGIEDVYSGAGSIGGLPITVAANLTTGDSIFAFLPIRFNYTTTELVAGDSRRVNVLNLGSSGSLEYDKLTGLLVRFVSAGGGQRIEIDLGDTNAWVATVNEAPLPLFFWTPDNPSPGQSVQFDASHSYDPDHESVSSAWSFGDGTTSNVAKPIHTYSSNGTYTITLTASDGLGSSASATKAILVGAPRVHDVAVTGVSASTYSATIGQTVNIYVQVANLGAFPENVTVQVTAGGFFVSSQTAHLSVGGSQSLTFAWDTHGLSPGPYTLSAYAIPVPGETNTGNNYFTDGTVTLNSIAQPDFQISANPQTLAMPLGQSRNVAITLQSLSGFSGTIHITPSYDTTHLMVSPTSTDITLTGSGVGSTHSFNLTIATGGTPAQGNYQVMVTGTNGTIQHSASVGLTLGTPLPPTITSVSTITTDTHQAITIKGSGFGYAPPTYTLSDGSVDTGVNGTSPSIAIWDNLTQTGWTWQAGHWGNLIGIYVTSWSDTSIVIGGFGSLVGPGTRDSGGVCRGPTSYTLCAGDHITIGVWGPSNNGIAYYNLTAAASLQVNIFTYPSHLGATSGTAPFGVYFSSVATGGNGSYSYSWNFGDGSVCTTHACGTSCYLISGCTEDSATHTYTSPGTYTATLDVVDGNGAHGHASVTITVLPASNSGTTMTSPFCTPSNIIVNQASACTAYVKDTSTGTADKVVATIPTGHSPVSVAVNSNTNTIYVSTQGPTYAIYVIDGSSNSIVTTIPNVGGGPIALNPNTNTIYSVSYNTVTAISTINNTVVASIPVGKDADAIAVNPVTNTIYVANYLSNTTSVISGSSNTVVATIPVGIWPSGIAVNPNTNTIYVVQEYCCPSDVYVISGSSNTVVAKIANSNLGNPTGVAVNPNTNTIYVAGWQPGNILAISGTNNTVLAAIGSNGLLGHPYAVAVNPTTNTVYAANWDFNTTSIISGSNNTVSGSVLVGVLPYSIAVNPATNMVYVVNYRSNTTSVIALSTSNPTPPAGSVSFNLDNTSTASGSFAPTSCSLSPVNSTTASCSVSFTGSTSGTAIVKAGYGGDPAHGNSQNSTSVTIVQTSNPDFSISALPSSLTIPQGYTKSIRLTFTSAGGLAGTISYDTTLSAPPGINQEGGGVSLPPNGNASLTATQSVPLSAAPGNYALTIRWSVGTVSHTISVPVTVIAAGSLPGFSLSISPASLSILVGSSKAATVTLKSLNGYSGTVILKSIFSSLHASLGSSSISLTSGATVNVTLSISTQNSTSLATYNVDVEGFNGTNTVTGGPYDSSSTSVSVTQPTTFDFSLSMPSPNGLTVVQGSTSPTSYIATTLSSGTTTPVTFSASGLPSGVTASFTNNPCSPYCVVTVSFSATATATLGTTTVTINASGGGASHSAAITLTVTAPTQIFTRVGSLTLNTGEDKLYAAVIDTTNGYAYFGAQTSPSIIVKVRLSDLTIVGSLTLNTGEDSLASAVIDVANGYAYFGMHTSPGIVVKVRLSDLTRVGALALNTGEDGLDSAAIDPSNGYAYFSTHTTPGIIVKIRLSDFTRVGALTLPGQGGYSALIDSANGFGYFGTSSGILVKVRLSDFTVVGTLTLSTGGHGLQSGVIDPANGYAYFGTYSGRPAIIAKVRLSDFTSVAYLTLNGGEANLDSAVIDPANGFAYFGSGNAPGIITKIRLSDFTTVGSLTLNPGENSLYSAVIDPANGYAYFGTLTSPGIVVKVEIGLPMFDFSLSNSGGIITQQGSSGTGTITATLTGGTAQPVALSCVTPLPSGISCISFSPGSVTPSSSGATSTLSISVASSVAPGSYSVRVTGSPIGATTTPTTVNIIVKASTSVSVSCSPSSVNVGRFTTCTATITGSFPSGDVTFATSSSTGAFTPSTAKCTLSAGACSVTYADASSSSLTATITASYAGDANNSPNSGSFSLNVSKPAGTIAVGTTSSTVTNGRVTANQGTVTGISLTITGSTAANGTPVGVTTQTLSTLSAGIGTPNLTNPSYYDVLVTGITTGNAQVCISFTSASSSTTMQYWSGTAWTSASNITVNGTTVCGTIPVSALTGTNIALANTVQPVPPQPTDYTLVYIGAGIAAIIVLVGAFLVLRRRRGSTRVTT